MSQTDDPEHVGATRENDRVDDALESGQHLPPGFAANRARGLDQPGEPVELFRASANDTPCLMRLLESLAGLNPMRTHLIVYTNY